MKMTNKYQRINWLISLSLISLLSPPILAQQAESNGPPPSPVKIEVVKQSSEIPSTTMMGTIYSRNQVQLTAGVTGRLEWVVEPGTYLRKGDLVAQIELLPLQLRQAEQKAQFKRAKINLVYLKKELKRQNELRQNKNTSQLQLEQTQSQVELAESDLEIAELQLKQINEQLARATLLSPFEGVVTERLRRAGYDVGRSDVLVELLDTKHLEVRVFIPAKYLSFTKPGTQVTLSTQDSNQQNLILTAQASTIIPSVDPLSQTFEMRINLPDKTQNFWSAGQLVKIEVPVESEKIALTVHRDALILRSDGTYIIKIDDDNKARRLKVIVGKGQSDWVTVTGEIKQGDKVAIRGAERLTEGQSVIIQSDSIESAGK
jgi:RND family efflux transporter MFP subunit